MATTRVVLTPESAHFPGSAFAALGVSAVNSRPILSFDSGATEEEAWWTFIAPQGLSGALSAVIFWYCLATSSTVAWSVYVEAVTPGDSEDLDTTAVSWSSTNDSSADTVPGTAGYMTTTTVTLTNTESLAVGDYCRLRLQRNTSLDGAAADACVLAVEIREA
jgi:hypothetical protein